VCANDPRRHRAAPEPVEFWRAASDAALTYPPPQHVLTAAGAWPLDPLGHPSDVFYSEIAAAEIADSVASFKPDIVVLEGLWTYRYIDLLKQFGCRVILDCHNVEAAVFQDVAEILEGDQAPTRLIRKLLPGRTKIIEQKALQAVDQIWVCSANDARLMTDLYGAATPAQIHLPVWGMAAAAPTRHIFARIVESLHLMILHYLVASLRKRHLKDNGSNRAGL
jgi:hypothetical protein